MQRSAELLGVRGRALIPAKPSLLPDWRRVLRHAWSVRFGVLAALAEGGRVVCDVLAADPPIPRVAFSIVAGLFAIAAVLSRFVAQRHLSKD